MIKGVAERVVFGAASIFNERDKNQSSAEPDK